jgi:hypothetical protein
MVKPFRAMVHRYTALPSTIIMLLATLLLVETAFAQQPQPVIVDVSLSKSEVIDGDSFVLTVVARNDGADATYGSISVSFPSSIRLSDANLVWNAGSSTGTTPGYRDFPQGRTIGHRDGGTVTAKNLLV